MSGDSYTIEDALQVVHSGMFTAAAEKMALLAIREHERAERLERNAEAREGLLQRRTDALRAAERRVAELEQWCANVTHAVEALTERKVETFTSCGWCGACSPEEAEGKCRPQEDQTGERSCPGIDGPVAEVWDDGAIPVVLLLREELQHASFVEDELRQSVARENALEARAVRAEAAVGVQAGRMFDTACPGAGAAAEPPSGHRAAPPGDAQPYIDAMHAHLDRLEGGVVRGPLPCPSPAPDASPTAGEDVQ